MSQTAGMGPKAAAVGVGGAEELHVMWVGGCFTMAKIGIPWVWVVYHDPVHPFFAHIKAKVERLLSTRLGPHEFAYLYIYIYTHTYR